MHFEYQRRNRLQEAGRRWRKVGASAVRAFTLTAIAIAGTSAACAQSASTSSQPYPNKPIRLIVGYAPGGGTDIAARIVARRLSEQTGQQFVVDNRPGANGNIGAELAAKALPDGYTLFMAVSADAINASLYPKLPFALTKDFAAVSQVSSTTFMLVVHPAVPVKNVRELIDLARSSPSKLNYATFGTAGIPHLTVEMIKSRSGMQMVQIPYKGSGPALADVVGGQVEIMVAPLSASLPMVKAGRLRALAVASAKRNGAAPDVPTLTESELPGLIAEGWNGILAPARTPVEIVMKLNQEVTTAIKHPDVTRQLVAQGYEPSPNTPREFSAFIKAEIDKWGKVIKSAGVKAE